MSQTQMRLNYLRHSAEQLDTRVRVCRRGGLPVIHIADAEFKTFRGAIDYLQRIVAPTIVDGEGRP